MTAGDPVDPLPILRAIKEVARRWEIAFVPDDEAQAQAREDRIIGRRPFVWGMNEAQLKGRFGTFLEASDAVFHNAVLSLKIRVWVENGAEWKRPTISTILGLLPNMSGLYVDQEELQRVFGTHWPLAFRPADHEHPWPNLTTNEMPPSAEGTPETKSDLKPKRAVGRQKGPGYNFKDVPVYETILNAQRESGDVETEHALVRRFAGNPNDPYYQTIVDRLRKGLPNWLDQNGHQWRRSK